jgi:ribosomal-protein-alanine N-acetyltransferase
MTRRRDVIDALEIEAVSSLHPWTEADLLRHSHRDGVLPLVAEWGDQVVGFSLYEVCKVRLHLLRLATHPSYRRRGVGTLLLRRVQEKLAADGRALLSVVVEEGNLPAQYFFRGRGFRAVKVLRGHNAGGDGYLMHFRLPPRHDAAGGR